MSDTKNKRKASENPFYILATVYGEQTSPLDADLHRQNRDVWNAWACQGLSKDEKDDLKKTYAGLIIPEWTEDLQQTVNDAFAKRLPGGPIPSHNRLIDFKDTDFEQAVGFKGFLFLKYARFMNAQFREGADFRNAQFTEVASFMKAQFKEEAYFVNAQFTERASFTGAQFTEEAYFMSAQFTERASFMGAQFTKEADFRNAQFNSSANFRGAFFRGDANFTSSCFSSEALFVLTKFSTKVHFFDARFDDGGNFGFAEFGDEVVFDVARFKNPAYFTRAKFKRFYPSIGGETLSGKSSLTARADFWPKVADYSEDAGHLEDAISSCAHLRHNMTTQGLPDEAHFFFRCEMDLRLKLSQGVKKLPLWLYGKVSDYGYSYTRPLRWLIQLWLVWTLVYTPYFLSKGGVETLATKTTALAKAAGLSFANIFAFFGFHSRFAEIEWSKASNWLIAFTGLETILGFILLFFLGLGLRNQFRLK